MDSHFAARQALAAAAAGLEALAAQFRGVQKRLLGRFKARAARCGRANEGGALLGSNGMDEGLDRLLA